MKTLQSLGSVSPHHSVYASLVIVLEKDNFRGKTHDVFNFYDL